VAAIASAFAVQLVDEVPEGGADRRVDAIVTEDEVIRTSGPVAGRRT
jgi:5-formyltetrahydrofolate cyclo-ligase